MAMSVIMVVIAIMVVVVVVVVVPMLNHVHLNDICTYPTLHTCVSTGFMG